MTITRTTGWMLRNLATRLILFLCDRFSVHPLDEARINMGSDKQARSQRWEMFAREEGGLFDLLDTIRGEYLDAMGKVAPGDTDKLEALAIGGRVVEQLRAQVRSVIAAGEIEARNVDRAARLSVVPARKSV